MATITEGVSCTTSGSTKDLPALMGKEEQPRSRRPGSRQYTRRSLNMQRSAETHLKDDYDVGKVLGAGGFCKVNLATHVLTGEQVAIKIVKLSDALKDARFGESHINNLRAEHLAMARFDHPNIVALYETFATPQMMYISMEYAAGGDLTDYVLSQGHLEEGESAKLTHQLLSALLHVHQNGIVHRDVKPDNVLLDRHRNVKLADFGLSAQWGTDIPGGLEGLEWGGTPSYLAPEVIRDDPDVMIGPKVDVWGVGLVLYAMLTGELPFGAAIEAGRRDSTAGERLHLILQSIVEESYVLPGYLSEDVGMVLEEMLQKDPVKRITISRALQSNWIIDNLPMMARPVDRQSAADDQSASSRRASLEGTAGSRVLVSPSTIVNPAIGSPNSPTRSSELEQRWGEAAMGSPDEDFAKHTEHERWLGQQFTEKGGPQQSLAERAQSAHVKHKLLRQSMKKEHLDILREAHSEAIEGHIGGEVAAQAKDRKAGLAAMVQAKDSMGGLTAAAEAKDGKGGLPTAAQAKESRAGGAPAAQVRDSKGELTAAAQAAEQTSTTQAKDRKGGSAAAAQARDSELQRAPRKPVDATRNTGASQDARLPKHTRGPHSSGFDSEIVGTMEKLGFNGNLVLNSVRAGAVNHVTMVYKILRAKHRRMSACNFSGFNLANMIDADCSSSTGDSGVVDTEMQRARLEREEYEKGVDEAARAMVATVRRMSGNPVQLDRDLALVESFRDMDLAGCT